MRARLLALCLVLPAAGAQEASAPVDEAQLLAPLQGRWLAAYDTDTGFTFKAHLQIKGAVGTWQVLHASGNTCIGREVPVQLKALSGTTWRLDLRASLTLPSCPDGVAIVRRQPDGSFKARLGARPLEFVRQ